jgi:hypothetical protein
MIDDIGCPAWLCWRLQGAGAYRCTSALGTQLSGKSINSFDQ